MKSMWFYTTAKLTASLSALERNKIGVYLWCSKHFGYPSPQPLDLPVTSAAAIVLVPCSPTILNLKIPGSIFGLTQTKTKSILVWLIMINEMNKSFFLLFKTKVGTRIYIVNKYLFKLSIQIIFTYKNSY